MYISDWGDSWYIDLMYVCQSTKGKRFHNVLMTPSDKHFFSLLQNPTHIFLSVICPARTFWWRLYAD